MKNIFRGMWVAIAAAFMTLTVACDDYMDDSDWVAEANLQLDEYIAENPDLSLFQAIITHGDMLGMVHAYGTYTLFAPTNSAVLAHFGAADEASALSAIEALTADSARAMVKYHMLSDTLYTSDFIDSRLSCANMEADYLTSKSQFDETTGEEYYVINRNARILVPDTRAGNGILHVVDGFLHRPTFSVTDVFADINQYAGLSDEEVANGAGYAILTGLMEEILNTPDYEINLDSILVGQKFITFLAQPDSIMIAEELTTLPQLIEALQENNISDYSEKQLLESWIAYHFLQGRYYKDDFMGSSAITTCAYLKNAYKVVTVSPIDDKIYINRFEAFDEEGIILRNDGDLVDFTCRNGVVQTLEGELEIIERAATRINWDMADQPEIRALKGYRKAGTYQEFYSTLSTNEDGYVPTDLSMMSWSGKNSPIVKYSCEYAPELGSENFTTNNEYVYGDHLNFRMATHVVTFMEIKTPTLVTGKYHVWLRYRRMGTDSRRDGTIRTTFKQDGQEDQVFGTVTLSYYNPKSSSPDDDEQHVAQGLYSAGAYYTNSASVIGAVKLGTIDVKSDGVHTLRFDPTDSNQALGQNYDMLMFIPIELDQVRPRVAIDGSDSRVYKVMTDENGAVMYDEKGKVMLDRTIYIDVSGYDSNYRTHVFPNQCEVVGGKLEPGMCPQTWCPNHDPSKFQ